MFNKHDRVILNEDRGLPNYDGYGRVPVAGGAIGTITSIRNSYSVNVRFEGVTGVRSVENEYLTLASPEAQAEAAAARQRREEQARIRKEAEAEAARVEKQRLKDLMTPKEGDIMPDDPRLAWLWTKIEHDPEIQRYCGIYDTITDKFGIPGREREMRVNFKVSGLEMSTTAKAHSPQEALTKVKALVPEATSFTVNGHRVKLDDDSDDDTTD